MSRLACLLVCSVPVLALNGCGDQPTPPDVAAQATASEAAESAEAKKAAAAARAKANDESLAAFYAGDAPADSGETLEDDPADEPAPSAPEAAVVDAPGPAIPAMPAYQAAPHPPPIPPVQ